MIFKSAGRAARTQVGNRRMVLKTCFMFRKIIIDSCVCDVGTSKKFLKLILHYNGALFTVIMTIYSCSCKSIFIQCRDVMLIVPRDIQTPERGTRRHLMLFYSLRFSCFVSMEVIKKVLTSLCHVTRVNVCGSQQVSLHRYSEVSRLYPPVN
jgi:hypothetical protein